MQRRRPVISGIDFIPRFFTRNAHWSVDFFDPLAGRLAGAVAGAGLDADQHRACRRPGRAASAAANLKLWPGTTRSSVSAVVTSVAG